MEVQTEIDNKTLLKEENTFDENHFYYESFHPLNDVLWTGARDSMLPWMPPVAEVRTYTTSPCLTSLTTRPVVEILSLSDKVSVRMPPTTSALTTSSENTYPPAESAIVQEKT